MSKFFSKRTASVCPYVAGEQPKDRKYVKLNTNENPYPPSPRAVQALRAFDADTLKLYPPLDMRALREAIARAEGVLPENIFCGNGSDEVLALCFPAFFDADGAGAAFADITYSFYPVFCNFYGIPARIVPLAEDFTIDLGALSACRAQGMVIANPNAPTGIGIPLSQIEPFVRENADCIIILDEAYMPFFGQSAVPLVRDAKNLVVVKTFSKGYALAGMRCGYAVADASLIAGLERCRDSFNSYPVDSVCQAVCAAAVSDVEYYARRTAQVIAERGRLAEGLRARGFDVLPSAANFLFARHAEQSGRAVRVLVRIGRPVPQPITRATERGPFMCGRCRTFACGRAYQRKDH